MADQEEKQRIRAKLSEADRKFLDEVRRVFPNAKLVHILFNDGEEIGRKL